MDIERPAIHHPSEEQLESYAFGRLVEPELGRVEAHLFVCPSCQEAMAETDEYLALMRSALAEPAAEPATLPWRSRFAAWGTRVADGLRFPRPVPAFSAAVAALSLAAMLSQTYAPRLLHGEEAAVTLRAVRGGAAPALAQAPADAALRLRIESAHLAKDQVFQARIVDAAGQATWTGKPGYTPEEGFVLRVGDDLAPGTYWVRLYDSQQKLLQEYGLQLR